MFSLVDGTDLRGCVKPPPPPLRHRVRFSSVRDSRHSLSVAPRVCRGLSHYWPDSLLTVQQLLERVIISILTSVCYHRTVQREEVWERDMVCEVQQMYLSNVMSRRSTMQYLLSPKACARLIKCTCIHIKSVHDTTRLVDAIVTQSPARDGSCLELMLTTSSMSSDVVAPPTFHHCVFWNSPAKNSKSLNLFTCTRATASQKPRIKYN